MNDNIKVTISGVFPKEDINLIADFYGGSNAQDKLEFCINLAQRNLTEFLSAPTKSYIQQEMNVQKDQLVGELVERVKALLASEITEV